VYSETKPDGFTLIELLVVISVIAILAALVAPSVFRNVGDAKVAAAKSDIEAIGLALDAYALHGGSYPTTGQGLAALVTAPSGSTTATTGWRGPYLRKGIPMDPWGHQYAYTSPGIANPASYDLVSFGRDGRPGGQGEDADLTSWGGPAR